MYKEYYKKANPLYSRILNRVGFNRFHIYNLLPENAHKEEIDRLRGELQGLKWDGLLRALTEKAQVHVRGKKRWVTQYQCR